MTRRPATHNRNPIHAHDLHATADCLWIIRARCRCLFTDCPCPCVIADMGCSWTRPFARTEHDRGLFADTDSLRSEPVRDRSAYVTADWLRTVCVPCHLQFMDAAICVDRAWSRTVRGPGRIVSVACVRPVRVCGLIVAMSTIPANGTAVPLIHRDCLADTNPYPAKGSSVPCQKPVGDRRANARVILF